MVEIKVRSENRIKSIIANPEESVLVAFQKADIFLTNPCNGRGTCGKCKIRIQGESKDRLACQTYPKEGMTIELAPGGGEMEVLTEFCGGQETGGIHNEKQGDDEENPFSYMVAVDLGTTTVVLQLLRLISGSDQGETLQTIRSLNPQCVYGADVISRITAANHGHARQLQTCICKLISDSIEQMCQNNDLTVKALEQIVIGGNTTMIHLLRGYDVSGLGKYPFQPVTLEREQFPYSELESACREVSEDVMMMEEESSCMVTVMPGFSAFVGGDITAGLYALRFQEQEGINLLVDLGTNGEMALGNKDKILVTSTAAGPAFEGGNLSCGVGSIPGAIKEVTIKKRYVTCQTIENRPAIGLCGTGAVDLLAELWTKGYMDEHGSFIDEELRKNGFSIETRSQSEVKLSFTQEDVRQMQLAKGAIRAGIEILLKTYGIEYDQLNQVYLAGGMGFSLNLEKAAAIGLIPAELIKKVVIVGNSCLGGVQRYLSMAAMGKEKQAEADLAYLVSKTTSIQLAEQDVFTEDYLTYMEFQKKKQ